VTAPSAHVDVIVDGRTVRCAPTATVAVALMNAGVIAGRRSVSGAPRGPVCGMGICYECRVTIDGVAHQRGCLVPVAPGMEISTTATDPSRQR
jgi:aerobic-type carbon monoxide dehydrogenase small subunit (CoxS/CutS family)